MVGDLGNHGYFRAGPGQDGGVDPLHIGRDETDQRFDRGVLGGLERYNNRHAGLHICYAEITIGTVTWRGKCMLAIDSAHMAEQESGQLRELVRTNDIVLMSAIGALLDGAHIDHLVADQNMSIIEGSLGILPRRILVHEEDVDAARQVLADAGLSHELRPDE